MMNGSEYVRREEEKRQKEIDEAPKKLYNCFMKAMEIMAQNFGNKADQSPRTFASYHFQNKSTYDEADCKSLWKEFRKNKSVLDETNVLLNKNEWNLLTPADDGKWTINYKPQSKQLSDIIDAKEYQKEMQKQLEKDADSMYQCIKNKTKNVFDDSSDIIRFESGFKLNFDGDENKHCKKLLVKYSNIGNMINEQNKKLAQFNWIIGRFDADGIAIYQKK